MVKYLTPLRNGNLYAKTVPRIFRESASYSLTNGKSGSIM